MYLRFKAPLLLATAAGAVFLCTGWACSHAQIEHVEAMRRQKLAAVATAVKSGIDGMCRGASSQADFLANLGTVRDALRSGDREALLAVVHPVYTMMLTRGVEEARFLDKDMKVFLTVKDPTQQGEDMSGRDTVARANRYRETQAGVEVRTTGLAVRAVASIDSGTEHLGSFEWGVGFGRLLNRIKETTGTDLTVFVDERMIQRDTAPTGSGSRTGAEGAPEAGAGLRSAASTNEDLVKSVLSREFLESVTEEVYSSRTHIGVEYDIVALPLFDFAGRQIGIIGGVKTMTDDRREITSMLATFLIGTGVGVVVLAFAVFFAFELMLRRPMAALEHSLEVFGRAQDYDKPIAHQGRPDEFGQVSKNLNKLREKIVTEAKLKEEAENIVTTRRMRKAAADATIEGGEAPSK